MNKKQQKRYTENPSLRGIRSRIIPVFLLAVLGLFLGGCQASQLSSASVYTEVPATPEPTVYVSPAPTDVPLKAISQMYKYAEENSKAKIVFSAESGFYNEDVHLTLEAEGASYIYYTLDGTSPTYRNKEYTRPIILAASHSDLTKCIVVRAIAYYPDGTKSPVFTHSYFMDTEIDTRFTTLIFSIVGDPMDLTYGPDAIFVGDNLYKRGQEMEREVYLEIFTEDGENVAAQTLGIRVYGGSSRSCAVKSMKLYARKSYDKKNKTIAYNFFDTPRVRGGYIKEYKKLVLRNTANDFEFAFIRDEFAQIIARRAGFQDSEGVRPVVVYLNGEYYALNWLHETYCDDYFKARYGDSEGEYVILEGGEQLKSNSSEEEEGYDPEAGQFQNTYWHLAALDLTDDENYAQVQAFMDVENYLDYFALNIYIVNSDWPFDNEKLYAYRSEDGKYEEEGVRDGRWRWLPHDMEMSFCLRGENEKYPTYPSYNNLKEILTETSKYYAPLFARLMERADCRKYFVDRMNQLIEDVFQPDVLLPLLEEAEQMRAEEMKYYYTRLEMLKREKNSTVWSSYDRLEGQMDIIRDFINQRPDYMREFLESELPLDEEEADAPLSQTK